MPRRSRGRSDGADCARIGMRRPVALPSPPYDHRVATDLTSQQESANALFEQKRYADALSAYTVLRKLRARQEGTDSLMYLSNTHSAVYCLRYLGRWNDALPLLDELSTTRDRTLGPGDASSLDAKRWWVWACRETGNYSKASDLEIEIADALYSNGDTAGAERAVATAIYYENQTSTSQPTDVVGGKAAASAANGAKLKSIAKKVGGGALAAGVTAAFEGVVGGLFN